MLDQLTRLTEANIELLPAADLTTHFAFTRDGFVALVERRGEAFGNIGAPGLLCEQGFAQLIWRGPNAFFITRGFEREATTLEIEQLRSFAADLKNSLTL